MATYADFVAQVRRELEESTATVYADASLLSWTNDAIRDFAYKTKCLSDEQYTTTTAGQDSYDLPPYTIEPTAAMYETTALKRVSPAEFFQGSAVATTTGSPTEYTVFGDMHAAAIYLWPTPSGAGTLRYWRYYYPATVTGSTDSMPFSSMHDAALSAFVKSRAFEQTGEFDRSSYFTQLYEREVAETDYERVRSTGANILQEPTNVW